MDEINETGNRYGRLLVLERAESRKDHGARWTCRCDCGNITTVYGGNLRRGATQSCGCWRSQSISEKRTINEVGNRYGRLVVLGQVARSSYDGKVKWLCQCDCGNTKVARPENLKDGTTQSCGCLSKEKLLPYGESALNSLLHKYKRRAEERRLEWQLSKQEFGELVSQPCYYCGIGPLQIFHHKNMNGSLSYNGVDRVDSGRGYVNGNAVPCCGTCNRTKSDMSTEQFKYWITRVYDHWAKPQHT